MGFSRQEYWSRVPFTQPLGEAPSGEFPQVWGLLQQAQNPRGDAPSPCLFSMWHGFQRPSFTHTWKFRQRHGVPAKTWVLQGPSPEPPSGSLSPVDQIYSLARAPQKGFWGFTCWDRRKCLKKNTESRKANLSRSVYLTLSLPNAKEKRKDTPMWTIPLQQRWNQNGLSVHQFVYQHSVCYTLLPLSLVPPPTRSTSTWLIKSLLFQYTIKEKSYSSK